MRKINESTKFSYQISPLTNAQAATTRPTLLGNSASPYFHEPCSRTAPQPSEPTNPVYKTTRPGHAFRFLINGKKFRLGWFNTAAQLEHAKAQFQDDISKYKEDLKERAEVQLREGARRYRALEELANHPQAAKVDLIDPCTSAQLQEGIKEYQEVQFDRAKAQFQDAIKQYRALEEVCKQIQAPTRRHVEPGTSSRQKAPPLSEPPAPTNGTRRSGHTFRFLICGEYFRFGPFRSRRQLKRAKEHLLENLGEYRDREKLSEADIQAIVRKKVGVMLNTKKRHPITVGTMILSQPSQKRRRNMF